MSVAAQCPDCCICPAPTIEWDSRSASVTKDGWYYSDAPGVYYLALNLVGFTRYITTRITDAFYSDGPNTIDPVTFTETANLRFNATTYDFFSECDDLIGGVAAIFPPTTFSGSLEVGHGYNPGGSAPYCPGFGPLEVVLSVPYTEAILRSTASGRLPAWDADWNDTPGSFSNLSVDGASLAIREARYRLRFKIPQANTGKNYRAAWVERFVPEAGVGLDSVEVVSAGVYRPAVAISAPPAGGTQAHAVAVMSSTGTVSSIRILNPGSGYTSAPTVTVQAAIGGGTSSTGWTATLSGGTVSAITGGSAGNYLPTLAFYSGSGSGATATCAMDAQGGIASVSLGAAGSGYTSEPTLTITAKVSGSIAADLLLHLGTETPRCAVWDGVIPSDYNPVTPSTYPIIGDGTNPYWSLAVPSSDGTALVANLRAVCDGSPCP